MPLEEELKFVFLIAVIAGLIFLLVAGEMVLRRRKQRALELEATPYTEQGLKQYDDFAPGEAVYLAWSDAGDFPRWHSKMQDEVRKNMPVLARALDRLVED